MSCRGSCGPATCSSSNVSATLPAALKATRQDGTEIALHLSTQLDGALWVVEARKTAMAAGERLELPGGGIGDVRRAVSRVVAAVDRAGSTCRSRRWRTCTAWGKPIAYPYVTR